jgi:putative addiction module killer protein
LIFVIYKLPYAIVELLRYVSPSGEEIFTDWFSRLRDARAKAKIAIRLTRMIAGNFGDCKPLRAGVWELRIDQGPGYRVYYALEGKTVVLLLCGGDKRKQAADIGRAVHYWDDYRRRTGK